MQLRIGVEDVADDHIAKGSTEGALYQIFYSQYADLNGKYTSVGLQAQFQKELDHGVSVGA